MPRRDYICSECEHMEKDVVFSSAVGAEASAPLHCGKRMDVDWRDLPLSTAEFEPFVTRNIHPDGKPLLVRNQGDLLRYAQEYGVRHVPDPDLVAVGNEIRRKSSWNPSAFVDMGKR